MNREPALSTPVYVVDEAALVHNLEILQGVEQRTGCHILLAQKAFSMFRVYPLIGRYLSGATASGLFEARLAHEEMPGRENHVFCPAYTPEEMKELVTICDHISFNSLAQLEAHRPVWEKAGVSVGLRVNPEHSTQEGHAIYDPCAPGSRLGIRRENLPDQLPKGVEGLHFHTLCEQDAAPLVETFAAFEEKFGCYLPGLKWINLGGGHHITRPNYDVAALERLILYIREKYGVTVYLEPGEAIALGAGTLITTVLDIVQATDMPVLILDTSAACHMPDVLEMPYRPPLKGAGDPAGAGLSAFAARGGDRVRGGSRGAADQEPAEPLSLPAACDGRRGARLRAEEPQQPCRGGGRGGGGGGLCLLRQHPCGRAGFRPAAGGTGGARRGGVQHRLPSGTPPR